MRPVQCWFSSFFLGCSSSALLILSNEAQQVGVGTSLRDEHSSRGGPAQGSSWRPSGPVSMQLAGCWAGEQPVGGLFPIWDATFYYPLHTLPILFLLWLHSAATEFGVAHWLPENLPFFSSLW